MEAAAQTRLVGPASATSLPESAILRPTATPCAAPKRGPVSRRRFQKGSFLTIGDSYFSMFYVDAESPSGEAITKQVKRCLGPIAQMSERQARKAHAQIMEDVNAKRGSVPPVVRGQTFNDATGWWRKDIAPNFSPATVRARESFLRNHVTPKFGHCNLAEIGVHELQAFVTELRPKVSGRTILQILAAIFGVTKYAAKKPGVKVQQVSFRDLQLPSTRRQSPTAFLTKAEAAAIISESREPFKTIFMLAWFTGMRAGEIMALTRDDLSFDKLTIRVSKSIDDNTRIVRQTKTPESDSNVPMPSALEKHLRDYVMRWTPNKQGLLFLAERKEGSSKSRESAVRYLHRVMKKLGIPIPANGIGLHAYRHGLATELVEQSAPFTAVQKQLRHSDVKTTLKIYAHAIPQSQRDMMERVDFGVPIVTNSITLLERAVK
jgi:integrase